MIAGHSGKADFHINISGSTLIAEFSGHVGQVDIGRLGHDQHLLVSLYIGAQAHH